MFTGIIECTATILEIKHEGTNMVLRMEAPITNELKVDQSVAHNGICLTVEEVDKRWYRVTAVAETLRKTNMRRWKPGCLVNLERSLRVGDRLDGHFVQGHVDAVATCIRRSQQDGSWLFTFRFDEQYAPLVIEKGSVCINGVSLTAFDVTQDTFTVTIIPYTYEHTNFFALLEGEEVNIEFDVLGKYLLRSREVMTVGS